MARGHFRGGCRSVCCMLVFVPSLSGIFFLSASCRRLWKKMESKIVWWRLDGASSRVETGACLDAGRHIGVVR